MFFPYQNVAQIFHIIHFQIIYKLIDLKKAIEISNDALEKLDSTETAPILYFKAEIYCEFKDEEALDLYLESANSTYDNKEKIKILEEGRKCAIRLNKYYRAENFEDLIHELKSAKE